MQPNSRLTIIAIIVFVLFTISLIGLIIFLYLNRQNLSQSFNQNQKSISESAQISSLKNDLFESQTATFMGKITDISGNQVGLENESGVKGRVALGANFSIFDLVNTSKGASHDIADIRLNTKTLINLVVLNGEYTITSITYPQPGGQTNARTLPSSTSATGSGDL